MEFLPKKYFIITAGPTGSGKTGLVNVTLTNLGIGEKKEYAKFLIDDLIENDNVYKEKIREIINKINEECMKEQDKDDCEKNKYTNPSSELMIQFNNSYLEVRNTVGCKEHIQENEQNCNEVLDNRLKAIVKMEIKPFIIVFEITGTSIPNWLLKSDFIPDDYTIIVSYSLVNFTNLLNRNISRTYKSIIDFKNDTTNTKPAPRLPDIRPTVFKKTIGDIYDIIIELYNKCVNIHDDIDVITCGTRKIDRLLIFDNNSYYNIIFDSSIDSITETELKAKIVSAIGVLTSDTSYGGKIKKTRQIRKNKRKNKSRRWK
jgi:hypothetical protein